MVEPRTSDTKHERRVVGHVSGWQEQMDTCVCGKPWPCPELRTSKTSTYRADPIDRIADICDDAEGDKLTRISALLGYRPASETPQPASKERLRLSDSELAVAIAHLEALRLNPTGLSNREGSHLLALYELRERRFAIESDEHIPIEQFLRYRQALYRANGFLIMRGFEPVKLEYPMETSTNDQTVTSTNGRLPDETRACSVEVVWQIMYRLADLLDSDQFNNIEGIVQAAGVPYPPEGYDGRPNTLKASEQLNTTSAAAKAAGVQEAERSTPTYTADNVDSKSVAAVGHSRAPGDPCPVCTSRLSSRGGHIQCNNCSWLGPSQNGSEQS